MSKHKKKRPSVPDLRNLFLCTIAREAPDSIGDLFEIGDATTWAQNNGVGAEWFIEFANEVLKNRKTVRWIVGRINKTSQARLHSLHATWSHAVKKRIELNEVIERVAAQSEFFKVNGFDFEWTNRRNALQHCRWLVLYLFKGMDDEKIRKQERVRDMSTVARKRGEFAKVIGVDLPNRRGRPRKIWP